MTLIACPACQRGISVEAVSCPSCGHPGASESRGMATTLGRVAGTYISATALSEIVLGSVMFLSAAAVLITLILTHG